MKELKFEAMESTLTRAWAATSFSALKTASVSASPRMLSSTAFFLGTSVKLNGGTWVFLDFFLVCLCLLVRCTCVDVMSWSVISDLTDEVFLHFTVLARLNPCVF